MRTMLVVAMALCFGCMGGPTGPDGGASGGGAAGGAGGGAAGGGAAGGAGGGAAGGSGGGAPAVDGGPDCMALATAYQSSLAQARRCNPLSSAEACSVTRPSLVGCGCPTSVNMQLFSSLDVVAGRFADAGCRPLLCPDCLPTFDGGVCVRIDGGAATDGVCVDVR